MWIAENPHLDTWESRIPYFNAKAEERRLRLYEMDLAWLNVQRNYENLPRPSEVAVEKKIKDTRTAEQIKQDVLKRLKTRGDKNGTAV